MSAVLHHTGRVYGRDFRPMPDQVPDLSLAPLEPYGWRNAFPGPADKTSDAGDREHAARCEEIRTRQWRNLDASTVGDIAHSEKLAEVLRTTSSPAVVGMTLLELVSERIEAIVRGNA